MTARQTFRRPIFLRPTFLGATFPGTSFRRPTVRRPAVLRRSAAAALAVTMLTGCAAAAPGGGAAPASENLTKAGTSAQSSVREDRPGHSKGREVAASRVPSARLPAARARAVQLPVGWPRVVPVPAGTLTASSARGGYAVSLVAKGSARQVNLRVRALYKARGFVQRNRSLLVFSGHRLTVTVALDNRDHSNLKTNVTVAVHRP